jgi:hypothetical protein
LEEMGLWLAEARNRAILADIVHYPQRRRL